MPENDARGRNRSGRDDAASDRPLPGRSARSHPGFAVVDEHGRAIGVIDPPSVIRRRRSGHQRSLPLGALLIPERLKVADADEHLDHVADRLSDLNVAHLPVVSRDDQTLGGYVGWKDLMRAKAQSDDDDRVRP